MIWIILIFGAIAGFVGVWLYFTYKEHLRTMEGQRQLVEARDFFEPHRPRRNNGRAQQWWRGEYNTVDQRFSAMIESTDTVVANAIGAWWDKSMSEERDELEKLRQERAEGLMDQLADGRAERNAELAQRAVNEAAVRRAAAQAAVENMRGPEFRAAQAQEEAEAEAAFQAVLLEARAKAFQEQYELEKRKRDDYRRIGLRADTEEEYIAQARINAMLDNKLGNDQ